MIRERTWRRIGRRFFITLRQSNGENPVGLGLRAFFWGKVGASWCLSIDVMLGPWDLQFGIKGLP